MKDAHSNFYLKYDDIKNKTKCLEDLFFIKELNKMNKLKYYKC